MSVCVPVSARVCGFLYELVAEGEPAGCCFDERILLKAPLFLSIPQLIGTLGHLLKFGLYSPFIHPVLFCVILTPGAVLCRLASRSILMLGNRWAA